MNKSETRTGGQEEEDPIMTRWCNFAGDICVDTTVEKPESLGELVTLMQSVAPGRSVRPVGAGWSFSEAAVPRHFNDTIVRTDALDRFLHPVVPNLVSIEARNRLEAHESFCHVEAGISVRQLYLALDGESQPDKFKPFRVPPVLPDPNQGKRALLTMGGAAGQTIAGAVSTATHGGDLMHPIADMVHAIHLVAPGGHQYWLERASWPLTDSNRDHELRTAVLGSQALDIHRDDNLFNAALVSVGRFGIVYSVVLRVARQYTLLETRGRTTWRSLRGRLTNAGLLDTNRNPADPGGGANFVQVVVNPYSTDGDRTCFLTTRSRVSTQFPCNKPPAPTAGLLEMFCPMRDFRSTLLRLATMIVAGAGIAFGLLSAIPIIGLGVAIFVTSWVMRIVGWLTRAASARRPVGFADMIASAINTANRNGDQWFIQLLLDILLAGNQSPGSWCDLSYKIMDIHNYELEDCYKGNSIELFFDATDNKKLVDNIELLFGVFDSLQEQALMVGGYISLRFTTSSNAMLATQQWPITCAVEVALLGGVLGNDAVLKDLERLAVVRGGCVHWGQENNLSEADVRKCFNKTGHKLDDWRNAFEAIVPQASDRAVLDSRFYVKRGLEVIKGPDPWRDWIDLGAELSTPPVVAMNRDGLIEVFALDKARKLIRVVQTRGSSLRSWGSSTTLHQDRLAGDPQVGVNGDGRLEIFVVDRKKQVRHTWQDDVNDLSSWSGWDVLGYNWNQSVVGDPAVRTHDGRIELVVRDDDGQVWSIWQRSANKNWSSYDKRGRRAVQGDPAMAVDGKQQLVVAARIGDAVEFIHQVNGPGSGWTPDWSLLSSSQILAGPLSIIRGKGDRLWAFVLGHAGYIVAARHDPADAWSKWTRWQQVSNTSFPVAPVPFLGGTNDVELAVSNHRGEVLHLVRGSGNSWQTTAVGGRVTERIAAVMAPNGRVGLFVKNPASDHLMARFQKASNQW